MKSIIKSFGLLLSFLLSILFFIFLLVFTITSFIRWNFKEEVLTQNIIKLDIYNIKANDILDDERNTNKTLKEALYIIYDENPDDDLGDDLDDYKNLVIVDEEDLDNIEP